MRRLVLGLLAAVGLAFGASALTPAQTSLLLSAPTGPSLDLNLTAGPLDSRISFARASSGSSFNSAGVLVSNAANVPRFDYNPVTLAPLGLLIEEARTNSLLNSAVLATQSLTVPASVQALSFYSTGTITLSGAYTGSLVGTGAFPARVSLIFTPTAGTLTLTVSGSVLNAQLE